MERLQKLRILMTALSLGVLLSAPAFSQTLGEITGAGAWEGHEGKAVDYFMRSIAIFKETGNEFELAKSYQAFSDYVASSEHYRNNSDIQREAVKLKEIAKEIFERHRISAAET